MSLTRDERKRRMGGVFRVSTGNFLEQYDFFVYGFYAVYIGRAFFPSDSSFASLAASLATFGVGFLMRPLGAVVLGAYIDRVGRRQGLLVTLAMMALGTLTLALTPGYSSIGPVAPAIIVLGRLLQGFSAGAELGGVSIYLSEIATPGRRGFYTSWQSASQQVAVIFAALLGAGLTATLSPADMGSWGWRVPLLVGCAIIPLIFYLRRSLDETETFRRMRHDRRMGELVLLLTRNWAVVLTGMGMSILTTTTFYLITAYTPTFGKEALRLDDTAVLVVTICVGLSNFLWLPIGGAISDRVGRMPLLVIIPMATLLTAYPVMLWLVAAPSFGRLLTTLLLFSSYFGLYNGAMIPHLAEVVPPQIRTAGFSLAFSLATALFGGLTPLVSTALIEATGNRAAPALWLSFAAGLSLIAVFASRQIAAPLSAPAPAPHTG